MCIAICIRSTYNIAVESLLYLAWSLHDVADLKRVVIYHLSKYLVIDTNALSSAMVQEQIARLSRLFETHNLVIAIRGLHVRNRWRGYLCATWQMSNKGACARGSGMLVLPVLLVLASKVSRRLFFSVTCVAISSCGSTNVNYCACFLRFEPSNTSTFPCVVCSSYAIIALTTPNLSPMSAHGPLQDQHLVVLISPFHTDYNILSFTNSSVSSCTTNIIVKQG